MSKARTIYACGVCASTSLLRDAAVGINDPGEVHEYYNVTCPNCGYDGTHHLIVWVPRDLDIEDIVDEDHTLLPEWREKAEECYL